MMRRIILMLICLLAVASVRPESTYSFQSLTTADGLSSSTVKCMLIDSRGFLWIGTDMGLDRYDGYEVEHIDDELGAEWQGCNVDELQEDAEGRVWIDSQYTYFIYNTVTQTIVTDVAALLGSMGIAVGDSEYKVKIDDSGSLWVLQTGRLSRCDSGSGKVETWDDPRFDIHDVNLCGSKATREQLLLCKKHAVLRFTRSSGILEQLELPTEMQREDNIYGTFIDGDHSVWVFSIIDEKICRYSVGGKIVKEMVVIDHSPLTTDQSLNNAIRDMMDDGRGNVWIATDHRGIFIYDKQTGAMTHISQLSSSNVISLVRDRQGTIWAGHYKTGISYTSANPRMFQSCGRQYGDISALTFDSKGNLWIGTDGNGLYVEQADGTSRKTALPNITVSSVAEDGEGTLWVGTYSEGLFRMLPNGRYEQYNMANGKLPTNSAWSIIADGEGSIWCTSTNSSLVRFDKQTGRWEVVKDDHGDDILGTCLCFDKRGHLLITSTYGLFVYDFQKGSCHRFTTNHTGSQEMVEKMAVTACYDATRDILLLGHIRGLTIFDMARDSLYYIGHRVNGRAVCPKSIAIDGNGTFWMSTASGISQMVIEDGDDGALTWNIKNYTSREGMQSPFFNRNASSLTADGDVLFGGIEGYTLIKPGEASEEQTVHDAPFITSVTVADRPLAVVDGRITLNHDDSHVTIRYFAGILNNAHSLRYAYKLEGMMADWTFTEENHITLVGLSPGDYSLLLRVGDDDGGEVCRLAIHVRPPFYLTGWAFLAYALIVCTVALLLWRRARQRKQRRERQQQFEEWAKKSHQDFKRKIDVTPSEPTITPLDEQFLQKAIKLVEDQMGSSDLTVESLGQQLGMSRSFLYKKLMAITGLGPAEFIRTIRVKRGMALLERSQLQITEIAYKVGFNSLKSFTMNFKAAYGITPI